jgi:hypothetical protein
VRGIDVGQDRGGVATYLGLGDPLGEGGALLDADLGRGTMTVVVAFVPVKNVSLSGEGERTPCER